MTKKIVAFCLMVCMVLTTSVSALAADNPAPESVRQLSEVNPASVDSLNNIDWFTFGNPSVLDGYTVIQVQPTEGLNLKMHAYLDSGRLIITWRKQGALFWHDGGDWDSVGHHWTELVTSCDGGVYEIRLWGTAAVFSDAGIYSDT